MRQRALSATTAWLISALAGLTGVTGVTGLTGVTGVTGLAYADNPDQRFLETLSSDGITGDPGRLVATGREVCDWQNLAHDENPWSPYGQKRSAITGDLGAQGLSMQQSAQFIRDAIVVYCPDRQTW